MKKMIAAVSLFGSSMALAHPGHPEAQWLLHDALHSNEKLVLLALVALAAAGGLLLRRRR